MDDEGSEAVSAALNAARDERLLIEAKMKRDIDLGKPLQLDFLKAPAPPPVSTKPKAKLQQYFRSTPLNSSAAV